MRHAATTMGVLALLAIPGAAGTQSTGQGVAASPSVGASSATDRPASNESASTTPVLLDDPDGGPDGTGSSVATDVTDPDAAPIAPATRRNAREPSANEVYNAARRAEGRIGVRLGDEMGTRVSGE